MISKLTLILAASVLFAMAPMTAATAAVPGPYFGISAGNADDKEFNESDTGMKLTVGYQVSDSLAFEGAYVDLGTPVDVPALLTSWSQDGFLFAARGILPMEGGWSLFGTLGLYMWNVDATVLGIPADDDGTDIAYGFGGGYEISDTLGLRAEWQRFDVSNGDVDLLSIGLDVKF